MRSLIASAPLALVLMTTPLLCAQTVTFEQIPGAMSAMDMTPDGRYIVGETGGFFPDGTYIYDTETGGITELPPLGLTAVAISDDGSVVLGDIPDPEGIGSNVAAIWTDATGWQSIGHLPNAGACPSRSDGYELSADGSVAVGLSWDGCRGRGFVWTPLTGMLELEPLANGDNRASVVSADGMIIGGFAQGSGSRTPAIWDGVSTLGELLDPPNGDALGEVNGISDDGTVLLGHWLKAPMTYAHASKWLATPGGWVREDIGQGALLPGWKGTAMDIADNGTIVGFDVLITARRAWIQPLGTGDLVEFQSWVEAHGGTIPAGMSLEVCQAISTDGSIICGHGGAAGGWIVRVDWPQWCLGDSNCSGGPPDFLDIQYFTAALTGEAAWSAYYQTNHGGELPPCPYAVNDMNGGGVEFTDIQLFVAALGQPCDPL
jgi:uncharacterized membrane protein